MFQENFKKVQNCLYFSVLSKITISKLTALCCLGWRKAPTKYPGCQCTPATQGDPVPVLIPSSWYNHNCTITSFFTSFSWTWGMSSCCKETHEVSPEERQVECLCFTLTVLLCTPKTETSPWHLLHFLPCLKHLVSFRDKCYAHARLEENTIVNSKLSVRNSSSVHLPKVRLASSIQLLFLPLYLHRGMSPSKAEPVPRTERSYEKNLGLPGS